MRLALIVPIIALPLVAGCHVPRPISAVEYLKDCDPSDDTPPPGALLFVTLRLPDCRVPPTVGMTSYRGLTPMYGAVDDRLHITLYTETAWRNAVAQRLSVTSGLPPILFIHGYNNSSNAALSRALAIRAIDGGMRPVVAVTWPSYGHPLKYGWDEANAEWSIVDGRRLIGDLIDASPNLTLVAHIMGNRLALDALKLRQARSPRPPAVSRLIMASPDVDREVLQRELVGMASGGTRITIYASTKDKALNLSWRFHGYPRAGDLNERVTGGSTVYPYSGLPGVELVDTSDVTRSSFGHANFVETPQGAADFCRVLRDMPTGIGRERVPDHDKTFRLLPKTVETDDCTQSGEAAVDALAVASQILKGQ